MDEAPLCDHQQITDLPSLTLVECKSREDWNIDLFQRLVGLEKTDMLIEKLGKLKNGDDILIWVPRADGKFSTKRAWECLRTHSPKIPWMDWVWHPFIPQKMSILIWKAMHGSFPVDDRLRRVGIILASKCDCCVLGVYEDQDHVLALGEFATQVWKCACIHLGMPFLIGREWKERVECWFHRAKRSSCSGQIIGILPIIITWRLWWRRCKARMEGFFESIDTVWISIKYWLSWLALKFKDQRIFSKRDVEVLKSLHLPIPRLCIRGEKFVRWETRVLQEWEEQFVIIMGICVWDFWCPLAMGLITVLRLWVCFMA